MKQYLYTSIIYFIIAIIGAFFLLTGCAQPKIWQSKSAGNTVLSIITVGQDNPTRGRCTKIGDKWHIQTEYKPNDKWIPLQMIGWPEAKEGEIEHEKGATKLHYMTGKEVLMEYWTRLKD